jgi:hypothetical protein
MHKSITMKRIRISLLLGLVTVLTAVIQTVAQPTVAMTDLYLPAGPRFDYYDQATALYFARLSELVYERKDSIDTFRKEYNAHHPAESVEMKFVEERKGTNTQVLLWGTKDFIALAFRGTEPLLIADWLMNGAFWNYENTDQAEDGIKCLPPGHAGFREAVMKLIQRQHLMDSIAALMKICNPARQPSQYPVYLTGHSLGAALSQMFITSLDCPQNMGAGNYHFQFGGAYHFAPPLASSCSVRQSMVDNYGDRVYDIVNYKDYVPRAGRNNTFHFGQFYRICDDDSIYRETERWVAFSPFRLELTTEFRLHRIGAHMDAIRRPFNTYNSIAARSTASDCGCMCFYNYLEVPRCAD